MSEILLQLGIWTYSESPVEFEILSQHAGWISPILLLANRSECQVNVVTYQTKSDPAVDKNTIMLFEIHCNKLSYIFFMLYVNANELSQAVMCVCH